MTTTTAAETGASPTMPHAPAKKEPTAALFLFALVLVVVVGAATFIWGLGALIISAVIASWAILALLVFMTAGS